MNDANSNHPSRAIAMLCLASSMTLVGSYVALTKPLAMIFPVLLLPWLRFIIGAVAMLHWLPKPAEEPPIDGRTGLLLFLESFLGNFLFTLLMVTGMSLASASSAGIIMAAIPAAVALLSRIFLKERISRRSGVSIALAVAGIALLAMDAKTLSSQGRDATWGQLLLVGAVFCEASYAVIGKRLTASIGARRITSLINLWGLALSTPMGLYAAWHFDFASVSVGSWALLVFYALAACIWTVWLWMTGLRTIPASQAGVFTVFLPISTVLVGVGVLGETLGGLQVLALGLAVSGVLVGVGDRSLASATARSVPAGATPASDLAARQSSRETID